MNSNELKSIAENLIETTELAGNKSIELYKQGLKKIIKPDNTPVTNADLEVNKMLTDKIEKLTPNIPIVSEETVDLSKKNNFKTFWLLDPIDGTKEFIEGVPQFSISIALAHLGEPIIGVIYNPSTNELFSASKNMGSFYNGERVKCLDQNKESIALVSRSEVKRGLWDEYKNNFKDLRPIGSVAYKLGLIGAGKGDIFVTLRPKNEWDICAGHCIINESGGVLFDLQGKLIKYNQKKTLIQPGLIAGSKNKVKSLLKIINI